MQHDTTPVPSEHDFRRIWRRMDVPQRSEFRGYLERGEAPTTPQKAALVVALARRRKNDLRLYRIIGAVELVVAIAFLAVFRAIDEPDWVRAVTPVIGCQGGVLILCAPLMRRIHGPKWDRAERNSLRLIAENAVSDQGGK